MNNQLSNTGSCEPLVSTLGPVEMCTQFFFKECFSIIIGYYTVICTIWKDIVLKTCIGRGDSAGVESNTGFQYNTDEYNIFPYCT